MHKYLGEQFSKYYLLSLQIFKVMKTIHILFLQMHPMEINNVNKDTNRKKLITVLLIIKKQIKQFKTQQGNG